MQLPLEDICKVSITEEGDAGGEAVERPALLKRFRGHTSIDIDDAVAWGCVVLNGGDQREATAEWALLSLSCRVEENEKRAPRWVRLIHDAGVSGDRDKVRISALTMWNYFGTRLAGGTQVDTVGISICYLPKYLSTPVPVAKRVTLRLLWDGVVEDLLLQRRLVSDLGARLEGALRHPESGGHQGCFLEGDSFWVPLQIADGAQVILVPAAVHRPSHESFVDFARIQSIAIDETIPPLCRPLPPPRSSPRPPGSRLFVAISDFLQRSSSVVRVFGFSAVPVAGLHRVQSTVREAAQSIGYPVGILRPEQGNLKIRDPMHPSCWILRISGQDKAVIHKLLKDFISLYQNREALIVVVLLLLEETLFDPRLAALLSDYHQVDPVDSGADAAIVESANILQQLEPQLTPKDALKTIKARVGRNSSSAEIPKVHWDDIAGCEDAKQQLREMLSASTGTTGRLGRRCGVLFHGPPGTGKTLLAKAIATECAMSFISVKGPELLDVYVGESEARIRDLFREAKQRQPCIIFFDEIDSIGVRRGRDGDSGGVADRLVSQLILEMDALTFDAEAQRVFMVGATNRLDLLDPALVRPGRFDRTIRLGPPRNLEEQVAILRVASRKYLLDMDVDLSLLAQGLPLALSPADLASICHGAMRGAIAAVIERCTLSGTKPTSDYTVVISMDDMLAAARHVVSSMGH